MMLGGGTSMHTETTETGGYGRDGDIALAS